MKKLLITPLLLRRSLSRAKSRGRAGAFGMLALLALAAPALYASYGGNPYNQPTASKNPENIAKMQACHEFNSAVKKNKTPDNETLAAKRQEQCNLFKGAVHTKLDEKTKLTDLDLTGAVMWYAYLKNVDLTGTNFTDAHLNFATLYGTNLTNANLSGTDFSNAYYLDTATLTGATYNAKTKFPAGFNAKDKKYGMIEVK